ncbi:MAG: type II toxin-antitoxin system mRNA interferase toxin, RelE/StbE family [Rhizobium sp.]|nr:MAG: type II toxin-antitoxin system mRNA interferase toxin, RelE/StbE family [Rhizobium sp.]
MKLVWSAHALADRNLIFDYIEAENPSAAIAVDERIASAVAQLRDFPDSGRKGRVEGTRELVIAGTPYIAVYLVSSDRVRILRVLHGAQRWPDDLSDDRG